MRFERKDLAETEVFKNVERYMQRELPIYEVLMVIHKSDYKEDAYLYEVEAKNHWNGKFAVWTCWNEFTQSMNFGHYGIESEKEAEKMLGLYHSPEKFEIGDEVLVCVGEIEYGTIKDKGDETDFYFVETESGDYRLLGASDMEIKGGKNYADD